MENLQNQTERNKAIVRSYLEELSNKGNVSAIDRYFAKDVRFNDSPDMKPLMVRRLVLQRAFPDHRVVIEDQIAEGDKVMTRVTFHATHLGEFNGIAATGRKVAYGGMAIDRLHDGKVVQMWHLANTFGLIQQISAPEAVAP